MIFRRFFVETKNQCLGSFEHKFNESMQIFKSTATDAARKFIFVCVNLDKMPAYLHSVLLSCGKIEKPHCSEIRLAGSLGIYLRGAKQNSCNTDSILFLDFYSELHDLYSTNVGLVDSLNVNRDLFMSAFRSVVIILSSSQTYAVMKHAHDLWSCRSLYIDTTNWFSSLEDFPIIKIRTSALDKNKLLDTLFNNRRLLKVYSEISQDINRFSKLGIPYLTKLKNRILSVSSSICYYALLSQLIEKVLSLKMTERAESQVLPLFLNLLRKDPDIALIDNFIMIGEFYYKYGYYLDAAKYYNYVQQVLLKDSTIDHTYIIPFLACNELICHETANRTFTAESLELKLREIISDCDMPVTSIDSFIDGYLKLVRCSSDVDSYAKHRDNYEQLHQISDITLPCADITDSYFIRLHWERFLARSGESFFMTNHNDIIGTKYQHLLTYFSKGQYKYVSDSYIALRKHLSSQNCHGSLVTLGLVYENMKFLMSL